MGPLLKSLETNPHATLIALFMNAVDDTKTDEDRLADIVGRSGVVDRLSRYMPSTGGSTSTGVYVVKFLAVMDGIAEHDVYFERSVLSCFTRFD